MDQLTQVNRAILKETLVYHQVSSLGVGESDYSPWFRMK